MLLSELLNKKVKMVVSIDPDDEFETRANINGRDIVFRAETEQSDTGEEEWFIVFGEPGIKTPKMMTFALTGNGGELEVFSMVKDSLIMLINRHSPSRINFAASKDGKNAKRADLYSKLIPRFKLPGYILNRMPSPDYEEHVEFSLIKQ